MSNIRINEFDTLVANYNQTNFTNEKIIFNKSKKNSCIKDLDSYMWRGKKHEMWVLRSHR